MQSLKETDYSKQCVRDMTIELIIIWLCERVAASLNPMNLKINKFRKLQNWSVHRRLLIGLCSVVFLNFCSNRGENCMCTCLPQECHVTTLLITEMTTLLEKFHYILFSYNNHISWSALRNSTVFFLHLYSVIFLCYLFFIHIMLFSMIVMVLRVDEIEKE